MSSTSSKPVPLLTIRQIGFVANRPRTPNHLFRGWFIRALSRSAACVKKTDTTNSRPTRSASVGDLCGHAVQLMKTRWRDGVRLRKSPKVKARQGVISMAEYERACALLLDYFLAG